MDKLSARFLTSGNTGILVAASLAALVKGLQKVAAVSGIALIKPD
jgi:hypothetical protein